MRGGGGGRAMCSEIGLLLYRALYRVFVSEDGSMLMGQFGIDLHHRGRKHG